MYGRKGSGALRGSMSKAFVRWRRRRASWPTLAVLVLLFSMPAMAQWPCPWNGCGQACVLLETCGIEYTFLFYYDTWQSGCGGGQWWCGYGECVSYGLGLFGNCNVMCSETWSFWTFCYMWIVA
jgi:hypothetical protein